MADAGNAAAVSPPERLADVEVSLSAPPSPHLPKPGTPAARAESARMALRSKGGDFPRELEAAVSIIELLSRPAVVAGVSFVLAATGALVVVQFALFPEVAGNAAIEGASWACAYWLPLIAYVWVWHRAQGSVLDLLILEAPLSSGRTVSLLHGCCPPCGAASAAAQSSRSEDGSSADESNPGHASSRAAGAPPGEAPEYKHDYSLVAQGTALVIRLGLPGSLLAGIALCTWRATVTAGASIPPAYAWLELWGALHLLSAPCVGVAVALPCLELAMALGLHHAETRQLQHRLTTGHYSKARPTARGAPGTEGAEVGAGDDRAAGAGARAGAGVGAGARAGGGAGAVAAVHDSDSHLERVVWDHHKLQKRMVATSEQWGAFLLYLIVALGAVLLFDLFQLYAAVDAFVVTLFMTCLVGLLLAVLLFALAGVNKTSQVAPLAIMQAGQHSGLTLADRNALAAYFTVNPAYVTICGLGVTPAVVVTYVGSAGAAVFISLLKEVFRNPAILAAVAVARANATHGGAHNSTA